MLIIVTGPSCSGKTSFARNWSKSRLVQLDTYTTLECLAHALADLDVAENQTIILEGVVSGTPSDAIDLIGRADCVIVLKAGFFARLGRAVRRDGPQCLARFLWNEFAWHRYCKPLLGKCEDMTPTHHVVWQPES